ncbi:hypothetical protein D9M68_683460 [compost metagenome]
MTDVRWLNRYNAYQVATTQRKLWNTLTTAQQKSEYLNTISHVVHKTGFFSLWMQAFRGVADVLKVIFNCLPNTSKTSFDVNFNPIHRNPTNLVDTI